MFDREDYSGYKSALVTLGDRHLVNEYCFCRDAINSHNTDSDDERDFPTMLSMCVEVLVSRGISIKYRAWRFIGDD